MFGTGLLKVEGKEVTNKVERHERLLIGPGVRCALRNLRFICSAALSLLLPSQTFAQSNGAAAAGLAAGAALGASSSQSSTTASSAGGSSSPIEMNIMAYGGIKQIATTISNELYAAIASSQPNNPASDHCATTRFVLLVSSLGEPIDASIPSLETIHEEPNCLELPKMPQVGVSIGEATAR